MNYQYLLGQLTAIADIAPYWKNHLTDWDGQSPGPTIDMACFVDAVVDLAGKGKTEAVGEVVVLMNLGLEDGDDLTCDVVATGFLEGVMNALSSGEIAPDHIVPLLSRQSLRYCLDWDAANGSTTPGISGTSDVR